jgi:hypothetical protein
MQHRALISLAGALATLALASGARGDTSTSALRAELGAAIGTMEGNAARLRRALHEARIRKDRDRVACASDGLSRADVALRGARDRARAAEGELARGDEAAALVDLGFVRSAREASRAATASVDRCFAANEADVAPEVTVVRWRVDAMPRPEL